MVIDLKVLVKSFNREDRSCYAGNPRERFLCEFAKYFFICDSFAKVGYYYHCVQSSLLRATTPAARGSGRRMAPYIYLSLHMVAAKLPKTRLRHSQIPWCWSASLHLPLVLPNVAFSEVSRDKLQMQQPSFQKWGFARAKHQDPCCLRFLWCAPCWWLGSADRGIFAKVPQKFCEGVGESQSAFWREWPSRPGKKCLISNNLSWEGDSEMLAACLQGYKK